MSAQIKAQDIKDDKESKEQTNGKHGKRRGQKVKGQFLLSEDLSQDTKTGHKKMKQTED